MTAINTTTLPAAFKDFIAPDCDRKRFILDYLGSRGVKATPLPLEANEHIVVQFPAKAYNPLFRIKTVLTHYDRFAGSPGANDNSAAAFQIMDWAVRLQGSAAVHNVRIIFTSGEELTAGGGVATQGAFAIAKQLQRLGLAGGDVYVFDCTGRGDVVVLSKAGLSSVGDTVFQKRFADLFHRTEDLLRSVSAESWISLPVPYSDNAGFLACGIPAVCVTILPSAEVSAYMQELRRDKALEANIMSRGHSAPEFQKSIPLSWHLLHTKDDVAATLTPKAFALMTKLLDRLAGVLTPV